MVVSSESVSVTRSVKLHNQCSSSYLRVDRTGAVSGDNSEDGYENLIMQSTDNIGIVTIYGEKSRRYLCFNQRWKLIGSKKLRGRCYFKEEIPDTGEPYKQGYYWYHSTLNETKYLGLLRSGRPIRVGVPKNLKSLAWVKIISEKDSISAHNEEISKGSPKVTQEMIRRMRHSGKHRLHKG